MCHPYIESATAISDYSDEEPQNFRVFFRAADMDFHRLVGLRNVSVDFKYDLLFL